MDKPKWYSGYDEDDHLVWSAHSPYHDDGSPFMWRVKRVLIPKADRYKYLTGRNGNLRRYKWVECSTRELWASPTPREWLYLGSAKADLTAEHEEILASLA